MLLYWIFFCFSVAMEKDLSEEVDACLLIVTLLTNIRLVF